MAKQAQPISNKYDFQVAIEPLFTQDGKSTKFYGTRRLDTGEVLGTCKEHYALVQNDKVIDLAEAAFQKHNLKPSKRTISVARGGARLYATYDFLDQKKEVIQKDDVALQLVAHNSFDGGSPICFTLNLLRIVCTNGLTRVSSTEFEFMKRHIGTIEFGGVESALSKAVVEFNSVVSEFNRMAKIPISDEKGFLLLESMSKRHVVSEKIGEAIAARWLSPSYDLDKQRNLWTLYNSATAYLTHAVSQDRFEQAQTLGAKLTSFFKDLTNSPHKIDDMLMS